MTTGKVGVIDYWIGMPITIIDGATVSIPRTDGGMYHGQNPHPEHVGKRGTIINDGHPPLIRLEDSTELSGAECWWAPDPDTPVPHTHVWRTVFRAPIPVHTMVEWRVCACGCEEQVTRAGD